MSEGQSEPTELAEGADVARPAVTVDVVMLTLVEGDLRILLVQRPQPPFEGHWALAGSFIRSDESLEAAAQRQLQQHLHDPQGSYLEQLYTFGEPERDPRTRVITVVYFALVGAGSNQQSAAAGRWFSVNELPTPLAFDHENIIQYTVARLRGKLDYTTIAFELLSPEFTLSELQIVHEAILNRKLDKRNFRKKVLTSDIFELQLLASDLPPSLNRHDGGGDPGRSAGTALWQNGPLTWRPPTSLAGRLALGALFLLFCVAFALVVVSLGTLLTHRALVGDGWGVVAALLVPLIPAAGTTLLITLIDRYEREPWYLLLCAFLWGAVIAIPPAFFIENSLNHAIAGLPFDMLPRIWADVSQSALFGLNAGLTEEAVKGAGLLVLLYIVRDKFENITDGILYGAIIGAGFAMIENIAYFANVDPSKRSLTFLILGRVVLGWLAHSTFTACFGAGLGMMREGRMPFRPWYPPLVGFVAGAALHSFFDFVNFQANTAVHNSPGAPVVNAVALLAVILNYGPLFGAQAALWVMLQRSLAREAGILREYLADEVRQNVISPEEYVTLERVSIRQRFERALLMTHSVRLWLATRTLYATAVGLAFAKWRAATKPDDPQLVTAPPSAYRARLRRLHRTLRALDRANASPTDGSSAQRG